MRYITKLYNWFFKPLISIFYFTIKHKTSDNRDWKCSDNIKQKTNKGHCWMSEIIHNEQCILIHYNYHFCLCPLCYVMVMAMYSIFYLQDKNRHFMFQGAYRKIWYNFMSGFKTKFFTCKIAFSDIHMYKYHPWYYKELRKWLHTRYIFKLTRY